MTAADVLLWELRLLVWGAVGIVVALALAVFALGPWRTWPR